MPFYNFFRRILVNPFLALILFLFNFAISYFPNWPQLCSVFLLLGGGFSGNQQYCWINLAYPIIGVILTIPLLSKKFRQKVAIAFTPKKIWRKKGISLNKNQLNLVSGWFMVWILGVFAIFVMDVILLAISFSGMFY
jgi:hypothetical protein